MSLVIAYKDKVLLAKKILHETIAVLNGQGLAAYTSTVAPLHQTLGDLEAELTQAQSQQSAADTYESTHSIFDVTRVLRGQPAGGDAYNNGSKPAISAAQVLFFEYLPALLADEVPQAVPALSVQEVADLKKLFRKDAANLTTFQHAELCKQLSDYEQKLRGRFAHITDELTLIGDITQSGTLKNNAEDLTRKIEVLASQVGHNTFTATDLDGMIAELKALPALNPAPQVAAAGFSSGTSGAGVADSKQIRMSQIDDAYQALKDLDKRRVALEDERDLIDRITASDSGKVPLCEVLREFAGAKAQIDTSSGASSSTMPQYAAATHAMQAQVLRREITAKKNEIAQHDANRAAILASVGGMAPDQRKQLDTLSAIYAAQPGSQVNSALTQRVRELHEAQGASDEAAKTAAILALGDFCQQYQATITLRATDYADTGVRAARIQYSQTRVKGLEDFLTECGNSAKSDENKIKQDNDVAAPEARLAAVPYGKKVGTFAYDHKRDALDVDIMIQVREAAPATAGASSSASSPTKKREVLIDGFSIDPTSGKAKDPAAVQAELLKMAQQHKWQTKLPDGYQFEFEANPQTGLIDIKKRNTSTNNLYELSDQESTAVSQEAANVAAAHIYALKHTDGEKQYPVIRKPANIGLAKDANNADIAADKFTDITAAPAIRPVR